jgi:hypothetical protein
MSDAPQRRVLSRHLTDLTGHEVVKIEAIPIAGGQVVSLQFVSTQSPWRQGVCLITAGQLEVAGNSSSQLTIWKDTAPDEVQVSVIATDGFLRFYNVWDSGRGLAQESQAHTSGMRCTEVDGWRRYECSDIAPEPRFDKLIFHIRVSDV